MNKITKTIQTCSDKFIPIKIASFHDVHLGHHRTIATDIVARFHKVLDDEAEVSSWDMLVFPGDLFDRLLYLTFQYLQDVLILFTRILKLAHKHDFIIRILEGTPGHDYKQSNLVKIVAAILDIAMGLKVDLKYVSELSIEYIDKYGITMLYVPDEWDTDVVSTYEQARELMKQRNLTQVDYCLLHGAFNYQIDSSLNPKAHSEELWSNLVRYYIFAGHVHFKSQYKNILVAGSFDRLAHGEEQPKGWLTCEVKETGEHEIIFHENKLATIYKTLDVRGKSLEEALTFIEDECNKVPDYSHIRLFSDSRDTITEGLKTLKQKFSFIFFTIKIDKKEEVKRQKTIKLISDKFQTISLDKDNIVRVIADRLKEMPEINSEYVLQQLHKHM